MIDPVFLSELRRQMRAELVLTLVQIEQRCPLWVASLEELAEDIGIGVKATNQCIIRLEKQGLLRRSRVSNHSGTWIWWVKRSFDEQPDPRDEPAWVLRSIRSDYSARIPLSEGRDWARRRGIPFPTLLSFLHGKQKTLKGQWRLLSSPRLP